MSESTILLDGTTALKEFFSDLSQVLDHQYDIDELFMMYTDWCRRGSLFVDSYVTKIYPKYPTSAEEEQEEAVENQNALRNAMTNLYSALDRMTPGLDRHRVIHAACDQNDGHVIVLVR